MVGLAGPLVVMGALSMPTTATSRAPGGGSGLRHGPAHRPACGTLRQHGSSWVHMPPTELSVCEDLRGEIKDLVKDLDLGE